MAEFFPALDAKHEALLAAAPVYFVATAPKDGRINLSPKGMDTLRVISPTKLAYLDLSGSGNETAAHLLDDGRITLMVCSFDRAAAMTLRKYAAKLGDDALLEKRVNNLRSIDGLPTGLTNYRAPRG